MVQVFAQWSVTLCRLPLLKKGSTSFFKICKLLANDACSDVKNEFALPPLNCFLYNVNVPIFFKVI
jgi:hypothetical protein